VSSGSALAIGTWTLLEICGSPGSTGSWSLYRDGTRILGPWTANTGTSPVGAITIGPRDPRTITVNVDDVVVDLVQG
jgi:hypothetical protein